MNKLKLSLVIALLGIVSIVGAQTASLSVKGGLNMSNYYGDNLNDKSIKPGFHVGVGADLEFMTNIALQTGLFFSTKGAKYYHNEPQADGYIKYDINANYLQLPIHIAYKIDVTPGTKVVFHAGPYLAYGVGGKREITSGWKPGYATILGEIEEDTFDKNYGFKPFDAGIGLGIGAEFDLITIDLGWDIGLKDIARSKYGIAKTNREKIRNQSAYLSLGYKF